MILTDRLLSKLSKDPWQRTLVILRLLNFTNI